jgi:Smr domain
VPPPAGELGTEVAEPVPSPGARPTPALVLDLPCLLVHEVGTPQAQVHLGVVTQVDHPIGALHCAAAPALVVAVAVVAVVGHVDGGDRFGAHQPSVRVTFRLGKCPQKPTPPTAAGTQRTAEPGSTSLRPASVAMVSHDDLVKLKLDLHDVYNRGDEIERALRSIIDEAVAKRAPLVEIIPGKGSGQLKKRVLRFLDRKDIKALYHRVEKDSDNFGRVFLHFRWK